MSLDFLGDDASPGASVFVPEPGTIFLDHTFAKQAGLSTGDTLSFNDRSFEVTDVRSIGNVLVTQFAFVSPQDYPGSPFRFCVFGFGMVRNGVRVRPQLRSTLGAANTRWGGSAARPGSEAPETESQRSLIPSPFLSSWSGVERTRAVVAIVGPRIAVAVRRTRHATPVWAVVAATAEAIAVWIRLEWVRCRWAVVAGIPIAVGIAIPLLGIREARACVAFVTKTITVSIFLIRVVVIIAVVACVSPRGGVHAVRRVGLVGVEDGRAVVTLVPSPIPIGIRRVQSGRNERAAIGFV